jgi:hypothetical protein
MGEIRPKFHWGMRVGLVCALLLRCASLHAAAASSQTEPDDPNQHRAKLLLLIAQGTQWPTQAFSASTDFVLGTFGKDEVAAFLAQMSGVQVKGRPVVVRQFSDTEGVTGCHMLYIAKKQKQVERILKAVENTSILTASEMDGFLQANGMVNLIERPMVSGASKVMFRVNESAARKAGILFGGGVLSVQGK